MGQRGLPRWCSAAILALVALVLAGCSDRPEPVRERAGGATNITLLTEDAVRLDARLWVTHPERVVIYFHEYREDQSSWWIYARERRDPAISALTVDFRGHGGSEGEPDDIAGMLLDADAAIHYARESGYRHIMLVGSGMGGAVAIVAAAGHPDISVVGLSVPSAFNTIAALDAAPLLSDRLALAASRDDLSAAYSLQEFRDVAGLDEERAQIYPGRAHGVKMLEGRAGAMARSYLDSLLADFWRQRTA